MPSTFQGFGTTHVGESARRADGSYVTTEWVVVLLVPLIPLRSVRLRPLEYKDERSGPIVSRTLRYEVLERLPVQWGQVVKVYAALVAFVALVGFIVSVAVTQRWHQNTLMAVMAAVVAAAIAIDRIKHTVGRKR